MSQQQLWPSGTPSMTNSIRKLQHCCCCNNRGTATHKSSSSSGGSSSTMYAYKTDFSILRRHLNHHRTYFYTYWNKKKGKRHKKKYTIRDSNYRRRAQTGSNLPANPLYSLYT